VILLGSAIEKLFEYLRDVIYEPGNAALDVESLPEDMQEFAHGLMYFAECVIDANEFARALSKGELNGKAAMSGNEIAAPLKSLHASLKYLTWQAQQIAKGDYRQRVSFMGDFSVAFNIMAEQLEERRKLSNQALELQVTKLKLAVHATKIGLWDMEVAAGDPRNPANVFHWSDEFRKMIGFSDVQDFPNVFDSCCGRLHPEDKKQTLDAFFGHLSDLTGETPFDEECRILKKNGEYAYFRTTGETVRDKDGKPLHFTGALMDITETKNILFDTERHRIEAEASNKAKSDFLARMTHEMRTPMSAIIGMALIGKKTEDRAQRARCFDVINEKSQQLLSVINDILDISEMETNRLELIYTEFSLADMLDNIKNAFQAYTTKKKQVFSVEIDKNIPMYITSDEKRLTQAITNLLSNAVKFTPEYGCISMSAAVTKTEGDRCEIRFAVKDTGIGISEQQQKSLFVPFEQVDGSKSRKYEGIGLGLAIAQRIVERLGGHIEVESKIGEGSSFIFGITAQIKKTPEDKAEISINGIFEGYKIMVAEDVEINREIIAMLLEETGVEIDFAVNGKEAVEKFKSDPDAYKLIFMDIRMPELDGYEATKLIRSHDIPKSGRIPIIAMTANVSHRDVEECLASGMNRHLGKPVDMNEILSILRDYLL